MNDLFKTLGDIIKPVGNMEEQKDPQIEYHVKKIKATVSSLDEKGFMKEKGNLMARVFLRATGAIYDEKGNYVINTQDIFAWFENGDYLRQPTEWDTM
jgi:hypothetical protein